MSSPLADKDIVWIDVPGKDLHPAVVVLSPGDGYVLMNGTSTPEDGLKPVVELSEAAAKKCGLPKRTYFYELPKYLWYWRPTKPPPSEGPTMRPYPVYHSDLRAAAARLMKAMKRISAEIQKLPEDIGVTLGDLKALSAIVKK